MRAGHCQNVLHAHTPLDIVALAVPVTIGDLLAAQEFGLALAVPAGPLADTETTEVAWVHSSDLPDPAPWLEPGQLLLSDGTQFAADPSAAFAEAYVRRLAGRGLVGLALSEGIVHDRIPTAVSAACEAAGLPLLRVPRDTPFIAVIRFVADALARDRRERLEWSLAAQRAVARAAASSGGLGATIQELEHRLGRWVALYDAAGRLLPYGGVPADLEAGVGELVQRALRDPRQGRRVRLDEETAVAVERIGLAARPLGVLAVGTSGPLDAAENDLVTSVLALAGIALEQRRALDLERRRLRSGALELLLSGRVPEADRVADPLWGRAPDAALRIAVVPAGADDVPLLDGLERIADTSPGWAFFAERGDDVVIAADESGLRDVRELLERLRMRAGLSGPVEVSSLDRGLAEARAALSASREAVGDFASLAGAGLEGLLVASGGVDLARRMLGPLLEADAATAPESAALEPTLRAWFEGGCSWDRTARALDVHRHTVRTRVARAGALLGRDLDDPTDRAETWLALRLLAAD